MRGDPLLYHVNILDDDPYITNVRGISSIDTAVNYTNPQTNQTITTLPAKRADFVITHADRSHSLESILITTAEPPRELLLASYEGLAEYYLVSYERYLRPITSDTPLPQPQGQAMALPPEVQQIFDSLQIVSKQETEAALPSVNDDRTEAEGLEQALSSLAEDIDEKVLTDEELAQLN